MLLDSINWVQAHKEKKEEGGIKVVRRDRRSFLPFLSPPLLCVDPQKRNGKIKMGGEKGKMSM